MSLFPYDKGTAEPRAPVGREAQLYWTYRTILRDRQDFGQKIEVRGLKWFEHSMFFPQRFLGATSIAFAFVATHNHFVLDRGGKVFKQSAPIIKLPETATEDDHLALLAYLNSSTACFWMKQVFHKKSSASQKHHADPARAAYEFAGTGLQELPIPALPRAELAKAARRLSEIAERRAAWVSGRDFLARAKEFDWQRRGIREYVDEGWAKYDAATSAAVYLQEEIDWAVYVACGLLEGETIDIRLEDSVVAPLGSRPFEAVTGYDSGVSARVRDGRRVPSVAAEAPAHWAPRAACLNRPELRLLEARENKRMWRDTEQNISQTQFRRDVVVSWLVEFVAATAERAIQGGTNLQRLAQIETALLPSDALGAIAEALNSQPTVLLAEQLVSNAVPYLAAHRYTATGLETWSQWNATWDAQRKEDQGQSVEDRAPPAKYAQEDVRSTTYWSLRGKLDVPKERFISYPGCESDEGREPVYGWAGWDHLQRAVALAGLYQDRKQREGWPKERLKPMLAGLLELLPWLKQWHHEPSAELGGERPSDQFEAFLNAECTEFGFTHDDLRAWRPAEKGRSGKAKAKAKKGLAAAEEPEEAG